MAKKKASNPGPPAKKKRPAPGPQAKKARAKIGAVDVWCAFDKLEDIGKINLNPKNPNRHPAEQLERLQKIIAVNGWRQNITISNRSGLIVKGHARFEVARRLGLAKAPVEFQDYATDEQEIEDLLADNVIAELAEFDEAAAADMIAGLDQDIFSLELAGFDPAAMAEKLLTGGGDDAGSDDERPEVEFTQELMLEHNYIVLYFDNPFDWNVAADKFGLKRVKDLIPRKGQPVGVGRVLNGAEWLDRIK